jgi:general secretion pathway protein C
MIRMPARSPQIASFVLFLGLCASGAYWTLHLMKPRPRAVAAPPPAVAPPVDVNAAGMLFGGAPVAAAGPSNYQLKGVVATASGRSAAIVAVEGRPAVIVGIGGAVAPGVTVQEVHPRYVVLMENGAARRLDLPEPTGPSSTGTAPPGVVPTSPPAVVTPPPQVPTEPPQSRQPTPQPALAPGQAPGSVQSYQPIGPVNVQPPPQQPSQPPSQLPPMVR